MSEKGVAFYLRGVNHAVQCLVAMHSLRKQWSGPVALLSDDGDGSLADRVAREPALQAFYSHLPLHRTPSGKNSCLLTKTCLHRYTPFECTLFLDADTFTVGPFLDVWPTRAEQVSWTQFSDWRTIGSPYQKRVERCLPLTPTAAQSCLDRNPVAINTGVFCFWRDAEALPAIHETAKAIWNVFIPDELAAHMRRDEFPHKLLDDRYNSSPRHARHADAERIVHCHGGKVLKDRVRRRWLTLFMECWNRDLAGVRTWEAPREEINGYLDEARKEMLT